MNVDLYTKTILTVIAGCLMWLCAFGLSPAVSAQDKLPPPTRVLVVDEQNKVINTANGLHVVLGNQPIPVVISNQSQPVPVEVSHVMPVALTAIQRQGAWQPIVVDVLKPPPTLMPTP
jgi:hypothetical protein